MSKYKVALYFSFGIVWATVDEEEHSEIRYFDSLQAAEAYGRSKSVPFEAVEVKA